MREQDSHDVFSVRPQWTFPVVLNFLRISIHYRYYSTNRKIFKCLTLLKLYEMLIEYLNVYIFNMERLHSLLHIQPTWYCLTNEQAASARWWPSAIYKLSTPCMMSSCCITSVSNSGMIIIVFGSCSPRIRIVWLVYHFHRLSSTIDLQTLQRSCLY